MTETTERKLEKRNRQLRTLMDTAGPAFIKNANGRYQLMNTAAKEVLGLDPDRDVTGLTDYDLFPEDVAEEFRADDQRVIEAGELIRVEEEVPTADGTRTFQTKKQPLWDEDGTVDSICAISIDITESKERERELERQNRRLVEFNSIVSHDLRNPLQVADSSVALAQSECDSEYLGRAERALDRMDGMISELLELARGQEGVTDLERINLAQISEDCWDNIQTADATFVTDVDRTIYADATRLKQILENLISNAIEHNDNEVCVTSGELDDGFYIEDDGSGIPEDEYDEVFTAGYSKSETGTGLGLHIVEQNIEAHDWNIRVTEGSKGGARFEITDINFDGE